jgi:hypothetical protein
MLMARPPPVTTQYCRDLLFSEIGRRTGAILGDGNPLCGVQPTGVDNDRWERCGLILMLEMPLALLLYELEVVS